MNKIQVEILGLSTNPASGGAYALILKETHGTRRMPIIIGAFEAQSIALEIEGIKPPRPLTHDLMKGIIETLGSELVEIVINDLRDGTFYAQLQLDSREVDARPSDAIALAVRFGVPIFVAENVMNEASFYPEEEQEESSQKKQSPRLTKLEALRAQLQQSIEREDYEKAAKLRDELRKLETHE